MADYDNNMSGALFHAKEKRHANSPDYTGSAVINGVEHFVSGWKKTSRNGQPYLSLAFSKKEDRGPRTSGGTSSRPNGPAPGPTNFDDDMPF